MNDEVVKLHNNVIRLWWAMFLCALAICFAVLSSAYLPNSEESVVSSDVVSNASLPPPVMNLKGEKLFKANCNACHKIDREVIGPQLKGMSERHERRWLYKWIRNSQELIKSGDQRANALYEEYGRSVMTAFPTLSDEDIDDIIEYVDGKGPHPSND